MIYILFICKYDYRIKKAGVKTCFPNVRFYFLIIHDNNQKVKGYCSSCTHENCSFYAGSPMRCEVASASAPGPIWQETLSDSGLITIS